VHTQEVIYFLYIQNIFIITIIIITTTTTTTTIIVIVISHVCKCLRLFHTQSWRNIFWRNNVLIICGDVPLFIESLALLGI